MLHSSQIIWKEDSMGEKEGRNTRVLSLFVRLSYGDILKKKGSTSLSGDRADDPEGSGDNSKRSGRRTQDGQGR